MIKKWISEHKNEEWFRPFVTIAILLVIAIAVKIFDNWRTENETAANNDSSSYSESQSNDDEEKNSVIIDFLYENKAHLILIGGITTALGVIEHKKKADQKLKER